MFSRNAITDLWLIHKHFVNYKPYFHIFHLQALYSSRSLPHVPLFAQSELTVQLFDSKWCEGHNVGKIFRYADDADERWKFFFFYFVWVARREAARPRGGISVFVCTEKKVIVCDRTNSLRPSEGQRLQPRARV